MAFLEATSDPAVGHDLRDKFTQLSANWDQLFQYVEKYMHVGDVNRQKKEYQEGLDKLDVWLRKAEDLLSTPQTVDTETVRKTLDSLMDLHGEVGDMEDTFKSVSRTFQQLVPELDQDEIENMMFLLKKEKENLVIIRSMIPTKIQLFHHLLSQLEAVDQGERDVNAWCDQVNQALTEVESKGKSSSPEELRAQYEKLKPHLAKANAIQGVMQSNNNIFQGILRNTEDKDGLDNSKIVQRLQALNDKFDDTVNQVGKMEKRMSTGVGAWEEFMTAEKEVLSWVQEAEKLIGARHIESKGGTNVHEEFFNADSEAIIQKYLKAAEGVDAILTSEEKPKFRDQVHKLKERWDEIQAEAPLHLMKVEFRLEEDILNRHVKAVEKQLQSEHSAFQRSENVSDIINDHKSFFENGNTLDNLDKSLAKLERVANSFAKKSQGNDTTLTDALENHHKQLKDLRNRINSTLSQFEQIPEEWREYEQKFSHLVKWMDTIDQTLARMFTEIDNAEDFESEKDAFQVV